LGIGFTNKMILSYNKNFQIKDFNDVWGKSLISMAGVIVTTGIEGNWLGKHTVFVNAAYEYLSTFFLKDNQFSLQMGMYF